MKDKLTVAITVAPLEDEPYLLGIVEPPTVNGKSVFYKDEHWRGIKSGAGVPFNIHDALNELWSEWRDAEIHPDTDSEFIEWLVEKKNWKQHPSPVLHTIGY